MGVICQIRNEIYMKRLRIKGAHSITFDVTAAVNMSTEYKKTRIPRGRDSVAFLSAERLVAQ